MSAGDSADLQTCGSRLVPSQLGTSKGIYVAANDN
jgi:hypothetical protein